MPLIDVGSLHGPVESDEVVNVLRQAIHDGTVDAWDTLVSIVSAGHRRARHMAINDKRGDIYIEQLEKDLRETEERLKQTEWELQHLQERMKLADQTVEGLNDRIHNLVQENNSMDKELERYEKYVDALTAAHRDWSESK